MWRRLSKRLVQLVSFLTFLLAAGLPAATFSVTNTADSGLGSLRQAILDANATSGTDIITFTIPGTGVHTIQPVSPLPVITDPVFINGYSQPGSSPNTLPTGNNGVLLIELDGAAAGALSTGLIDISAGASTVHGLVVVNAQGGDGIQLRDADGNVVAGNFIGVRADGTTGAGNGCAGIRAGSSGNTIGGSAPGDRNLVSSTSGCGIDVVIAGTSNSVLGNYIGTNAAGTIALGGAIGIDVTGTSQMIGGPSAGAGNVISGHSGDGIRIRDGAAGNLVQGNLIGTNATGTAPLANASGISIVNSSPNNVIGGAAAGARNVISGNTIYGVTIKGPGSTGNMIQGNFIGTDAAGAAALGNPLGVYLESATGTTIGGTVVGSGNVISGNQYGIKLMYADGTANVIEGNLIGLSAAGNTAVPNVNYGVWIITSRNTLIGSSVAGARNVISGNGVAIALALTDGTQILGNFIGLDLAGTTPIPGFVAIIDESSSNLIIGTSAPGGGNVIAGNSSGLQLGNSTNVSIRGNTIGLNLLGAPVFPRHGSGINLIMTTGVVVGGSGNGEGNIVSGNNAGIIVSQGTATSILGNWIGTDRIGALGLGNVNDGIYTQGPTNIGDGTSSGSNVIARNGQRGVAILNTNAVLLQRNSIFANGESGIDLGGDGPTPNDPGDPDTGANGLQNFPFIRSTTADSSNTTVVGSFNSLPSTTYTLEFFSNLACAASGYGEGETFLGSASVTTNSSGDASFNLTFPTVNPSETVITATATDPNGNTSEFSACGVVPPKFYTLAPCRVIDTRSPVGPYGGPSLTAGSDRTFVFGGQCGIPSTATAVALNVVAVLPTDGPGFLTLWPAGFVRPLASTINYNKGGIRANNAIISLGSLADLAVHCGQGAGTADIVIDVTGFFQ